MSELDDFLAEIAAVEEAVASGAISTDDRDDTNADAPQQYAPPTSHAETSHVTAPPASASNDLPHLSAAEVEGDVADAPDGGGSGAEIRAQNSNATSSINGAPSRTAISAATAAAQSVKPSGTAATSKPASFAPRQAVKSVVAFKPAVLSKPAVISKAAQPSSTASAAGPAGAASSSSSSSAASGPYPSSAASSMQQQQYQQQQQQQMMIDAAAYAASVGGVGFGMGRHGAAAGSGGSGYCGGSSAAGAGWPNAGAGAASAAGYGGEPHAGEKRKFIRVEAGEQWEDPTLGEWPENDYRLFCGDLGHDVTDDILAGACVDLEFLDDADAADVGCARNRTMLQWFHCVSAFHVV